MGGFGIWSWPALAGRGPPPYYCGVAARAADKPGCRRPSPDVAGHPGHPGPRRPPQATAGRRRYRRWPPPAAAVRCGAARLVVGPPPATAA